jgi:hypothetical protein
VRDGQPLTSDGPFAEAKEQVAARVAYVDARPILTYSHDTWYRIPDSQ